MTGCPGATVRWNCHIQSTANALNSFFFTPLLTKWTHSWWLFPSRAHDPPYAHRNICCTGCKCDVINVRYLMRWKICTNYGSYGCSGLWLPVGQGKCDVRGDQVQGERMNGETGERWSFWANVRWRNLSDRRNRGISSMVWKRAYNATIHLPQSAAPSNPKFPNRAQLRWHEEE